VVGDGAVVSGGEELGGSVAVEDRGSAEVDGRAELAPKWEECVVICIDRSGSMRSPFSTDRTRMEAVKQMFYAFRDRTENVGNNTHQLGLFQFDQSVEGLLELTSRLDRFEAIVDDMETRGSTAIYSAIAAGVEMLRPVFDVSPDTDLRVVLLTDGQNNAGIPAEKACALANEIGVVVDAIIVGDVPDSNLRKIVAVTNGECYQIRNLGEGFELLEAETVVSLRARRGGADKPPFVPKEIPNFLSVEEKAIQSKAKQADSSSTLQFSQKKVMNVSAITSSSRTGNSGCDKRIRQELSNVGDSESLGVHIFPVADNIQLWRVLLEGPPTSPFEGGVFALEVIIPDDYPFKPPKIKFQTPIYHCNVSEGGAICLDTLKDQWSPALSVMKILLQIREMMLNPNTDDALRQWIAERAIAYRNSGGKEMEYINEAKAQTQQHASRTVMEWKTEFGCT